MGDPLKPHSFTTWFHDLTLEFHCGPDLCWNYITHCPVFCTISDNLCGSSITVTIWYGPRCWTQKYGKLVTAIYEVHTWKLITAEHRNMEEVWRSQGAMDVALHTNQHHRALSLFFHARYWVSASDNRLRGTQGLPEENEGMLLQQLSPTVQNNNVFYFIFKEQVDIVTS